MNIKPGQNLGITEIPFSGILLIQLHKKIKQSLLYFDKLIIPVFKDFSTTIDRIVKNIDNFPALKTIENDFHWLYENNYLIEYILPKNDDSLFNDKYIIDLKTAFYQFENSEGRNHEETNSATLLMMNLLYVTPRIMGRVLELEHNISSTPILNRFPIAKKIHGKTNFQETNVISLVLDEFPSLDNSINFEQLAEFKEYNRMKLSNLQSKRSFNPIYRNASGLA